MTLFWHTVEVVKRITLTRDSKRLSSCLFYDKHGFTKSHAKMCGLIKEA